MKQLTLNIGFITIATVCFLFSSCSCNKRHPGYEFMPDMSHTKAYKTYSANPLVEDSMSALRPPEHAIARGPEPYPYPNTKEGYEQAGKELTNPLPKSKEVLKEGKRLFNIYCQVCHGKKGKGDGPITITSDGPFPPPPAFSSNQLNTLPEGKIYHSITYGKLNTQMKSYADQLNRKERWMVTHYVEKLQGKAKMDTVQSDTSQTTSKVDTVSTNKSKN